MVSCRNVMIYFKPVLQDRVRSIFHYSLNPGGYLWLGSSESVGETSELFAAVDRKHKVYSRRVSSDRINFDFVTSEYFPASSPRSLDGAEPFDESYSSVRRQADQIVLGRYAPVGVVVNDQLDILHFRGNTSPYLVVASGDPSFNLLKMIRPELLLELRAAISEAKEQDVAVRKEDLYVENNAQEIAIEITPVGNPVSQMRNYLVLFEPIAADVPETDVETDEMARSQAPKVSRLERSLAATRRELLDTKAYLQAMVEEKEDANQRLTIANEEILSSNEELQSTNEELRTAKEEIQAANEELKTTNEELQNRNASAQTVNDDLVNLLNNVNIPIVILTSDLRIRRFTPVAQQLFKFIPTDVGRLLSDIRINIDIPDLEQTILAVTDSLEAQEKEVQDAQGRWYQLRIRPYQTAEKQTEGAVMALVDIDHIKRTQQQQQLEQSQRYAEAIVETVSEPLLVVTEALVVCTANRAFHETFQVSEGTAEGRSLFELGNGQWNIPALQSHLTTLIDNPRRRIDPIEITHEFEHIGSKIMRLKVREIEHSGPDRMILLSIEDITERRQAEAQRLLQAQTARAQAEAANIGKDQFLSVISHELRTPLNAILGWSSLLVKMESPTPDVLHKALNSINRSAKNQNRIISDLLEVSRILQNKTKLQLEPTNLSDFLKTAVEMIQPTAAEAEVTLSAELATSSDFFRLDPSRLHQVFGNAISNAIKFTPAGGSIQVSLVYEDKNGEYENAGDSPEERLRQRATQQARITITDSGAGITPDFLPYVFDRFRQANSTNTRQYGGLGLGLAIVKSFTEEHGGTVEISSPGEDLGATMTILLPLTPAKAASPRPSLSPSEDHLIRTARLLLVEDDLSSLEMMKTALEMRGATVITAESVARAIEILASQNGEPSTAIDLILSDISMPEQDGFDLIRWVRSHENPQIRQIPAIAVTGFATRAHTDSILKAGFVYHLTKPIDLDLLVSAILSTLDQSDDYEEN
ncbi:MAG: ATPase [Leptolyngbya foveolarum]|uniref:histidine kinase n=1 Tax=Leptolyngbya foveolarum TaxID=47253 RepID=A0A2W4UFK0_9CYAN|nr:MAG: ATPase [Leptolyngbya foveolarum]